MNACGNLDNLSHGEIKLLLEIWDNILVNLKSCNDRNNARLVCPLWKELLNSDCSGEKMLVPWDAPSDPKKWSVLMKSERREINYHIIQPYGNLKAFGEFFTERGNFITSLHISECPSFELSELKMILSKCQHLEMLTISEFEYSWFRKMHQEEVTHDGLTHLMLSPTQIRHPITPFQMRVAIYHIRNVLPHLQRLEIENLNYFPDANQLERLQNMRHNMVILGTDKKNNEFGIDERNNAYVNIKYAEFTLNSIANTFTTNYKLPFGTTEESLLQFMTRHNNLENLRIIFSRWHFRTLNFPPLDYNITQSNLKKVKIKGAATVVLRHCPILFNKLESLTLRGCSVENLSPEIIALMTNMRFLTLTRISYRTFIAVCEHLPSLEVLSINCCLDFDSELHKTEIQQHLKKLTNLERWKIPREMLDTIEENS